MTVQDTSVPASVEPAPGQSGVKPRPDGAFDLPGGGWALIPDPDTFTHGDRKALVAKIGQPDGKGQISLEQAMQHSDRVVAIVLIDWSLSVPLPTEDDTSVLDELPAKTVDKLMDESKTFMERLQPDFSETDQATEPDSPTGPSNG